MICIRSQARPSICGIVASTAALISCSSWAGADTLLVPSQFPSIRAAVVAAQSGDEILLDDGVYVGEDNRNIDIVETSLTIRGKTSSALTIIDCESLARAFRFVSTSGVELDMRDITVRNGNADLGGALLSQGGTTILRNCTFNDNRATRSGDESATGGAVLCVDGALQAVGCVFYRNRGWAGGGIGLARASADISHCTFESNRWVVDGSEARSSAGGGVLVASENEPVSVRIADSTFYANEAQFGGGLAGRSSTFLVERCAFQFNRGAFNQPGFGGSVYLNSSSLRTVDCQIADSFPTGIYLEVSSFDALRLTIERCNETIAAVGSGTSTFVSSVFRNNLGGSLVGFQGQFRFQNCLFVANEAGPVLSAVGSGVISAVNCTFYRNEGALGRSSILGAGSASAALTNCIINSNTTPIFQVTVPPEISVKNSVVQGGYPGGNIQGNPRFRDAQGPDGIVGTDDDDLSPLPGSRCIDAGRSEAVLRDYLDVDGDGDTQEKTPIDIGGSSRIFDDPMMPDAPLPGTPPRVDIGAYELVRPCAQPGDVDADGDVDLTDLCFILHHFGTATNAILADGDLDFDADVDIVDLANMLREFGMSCVP